MEKPSPAKKPSPADIRDRVVEVFDNFFKHAYAVHEPLWKARTDAMKTLASVSSASIVLSVTFSSTLKALEAGLGWRLLILFAFLMLSISLMAALAAIWTGISLHALQRTFFDKEEEITKPFLDPGFDIESPFKIPDELADLINREEDLISKKDNWAGRFSRVSFIGFALAMVALVIIGLRQFAP
jgi:hypothetical protein